MRPLTAEDEATLRAIAARHGYRAARGPHTGDGSASRLLAALLTGEIITLALAPAERRRLVAWLDDPDAPRPTAALRGLASQLRATLPAEQDQDAYPRIGPTSDSQPASIVDRDDEGESSTRRRLDVELWLRVENNSKFVRGKTKARAWIEDRVLRPHAMRQPYGTKNEYVLTLTYDTDEDLDAAIDDILCEAERIAALHYCFTEADVRALDGSDRYW